MNQFGSDLFSDLIIFGSFFNIQELPFMLVAIVINFGVKNQVPQVSFKIVVGDLMSILSREFTNIVFCGSLFNFEAIAYYGAQEFSLCSLGASLPFYLITCSSPHRIIKEGDILHMPRHLLLKLGADFSNDGFLFKYEIYHFIWFSSHCSNSQ